MLERARLIQKYNQPGYPHLGYYNSPFLEPLCSEESVWCVPCSDCPTSSNSWGQPHNRNTGYDPD